MQITHNESISQNEGWNRCSWARFWSPEEVLWIWLLCLTPAKGRSKFLKVRDSRACVVWGGGGLQGSLQVKGMCPTPGTIMWRGNRNNREGSLIWRRLGRKNRGGGGESYFNLLFYKYHTHTCICALMYVCVYTHKHKYTWTHLSGVSLHRGKCSSQNP